MGAAEMETLSSVLTSPAALSSGGWRERFEERFRELCGSRHALTVTSGTVALEIAVHLLDLRPGDEVVVTPQTYQATVQPLLGHDVTVRFCDVEPDSLNMDPDKLAPLLTDRTRAVILVHYGGWPAEMDRIVKLAHEVDALVVEDCAHSLGGAVDGRRPGALGDIGCFSFHSSKNITTLGEGGMITFDRDDWATRVDRIRSNEVDGEYYPVPAAGVPAELRWMKYAQSAYGIGCSRVRRAGTNATLSEAACAVGLVQLDRLTEMADRRRHITNRLNEVISRYPGVRAQHPRDGIRHAHHLYTFFAGDRVRRARILAELDRRGIELQLRYFPLHLTPEWRALGHGDGECPVAERLWFTEHINLPCQPVLTDAQIDHLVWALDVTLAGTAV
ncbi:DegT/DnrJ/EryC1/StrS family aminotransferase [Solwaraspora sp. WMMB335]|uniref:DegT/DnrJ/EryC1/StrS family aminotransferase n=1 Tax=Solwaraspora sp. WMMB335 TaxID=3404118 RepID=UPI003B93A6C0